jgi:hypothetical protein
VVVQELFGLGVLLGFGVGVLLVGLLRLLVLLALLRGGLVLVVECSGWPYHSVFVITKILYSFKFEFYYKQRINLSKSYMQQNKSRAPSFRAYSQSTS